MALRRILIVDDSPDVRRMLAISLRMLGQDFDVLEVPSAEEALLVGSSLPLDLMVADVRLPGMSGLDMLERLRKHSPNLKVILVTGLIDPHVRQVVAAAGADAFFYKPLEMDAFVRAVEQLMGLAEDAAPLPLGSELPAIQSSEQAEVSVEKPVPTLAERLSTLRQELGAQATLLLDDSGNVLAQAGDLTDVHNEPGFMPAIMATMSAGSKVSLALGSEVPDHLMFFSGSEYHLCLAPVGNCTLLVASKVSFQSLSLTGIRQTIHQAAVDLQVTLADIGVEVKRSQEVPSPPQAVELPLDPQALAGLDSLFAGRESIKDQDVDAFWDALSEQSELGEIGNPDALTYEQARQLGLAPEQEQDEHEKQ